MTTAHFPTQVLWKYFDTDNNPILIWAPGTVTRIADGLADKRSSRAKKILPAGAVLWAWDADPSISEAAGEQWLFLLPDKWNPSRHGRVYSWRYYPRELSVVEPPASDERRTHMRRAAYEPHE